MNNLCYLRKKVTICSNTLEIQYYLGMKISAKRTVNSLAPHRRTAPSTGSKNNIHYLSGKVCKEGTAYYWSEH